MHIRICILGDNRGNIDEGMKKIADNLSKELSKFHEVLILSPLKAFSADFYTTIRDFDPQIVHYIPGPSIKSFFLMKTLSFFLGNAKFIMSTLFPKLGFSKAVIHLLKPHLILIQSEETERMFSEKGFNTKFLPLSGVDIQEFVPVSRTVKERLREKYNINKDKFVILHIGHVKEKRNLLILGKIREREKGCQVIIIGSTSTNVENRLYKDLKKSGCVVCTDYLENINEIYALSDCYVFPVMNRFASIDIPLSVLEAMACNLPVITTKFGGLPRIFENEDGLFFIEQDREILITIDVIRNSKVKVKTREKVLSYSWENITKDLVRIYEGLLHG